MTMPNLKREEVLQGDRPSSLHKKNPAVAFGLHPLARECLARIRPYVPGKPVEEVCRELGFPPSQVVKLASNESPIGPSPLVVEAIRQAAGTVHVYPESTPPDLVEAIAARFEVSPSQVILGNGLDNVISMLCQAFIEDGKASVMSEYTFLPYGLATMAMGGRVVRVPMKDFSHDLDRLLEAVRADERVRLLFLCNPNNPTGAWVGHSELTSLLDRLPDHCLLVLDEAYADFADEGALADGPALVREGAPVAVLRTFSKVYGLAGLRVGFALAAREVIAALARVREAFPLNRLAYAAAKAALQDCDHAERCVKVVKDGRRQICCALDEMGIRYLPSQANFIMIEARPDADTLARKLLERGVIVRSLSGWGLTGWIRLSVGTAEQNQAFFTALREILHS